MPPVKIILLLSFLCLSQNGIEPLHGWSVSKTIRDKNSKSAITLIDTLIEQANAHQQSNDFELARKSLMKAYTLMISSADNKKKVDILQHLYDIYINLGDYSAAEDALRGARNLDRENSASLTVKLAHILYMRNQFDEAFAELSTLRHDSVRDVDKQQFDNLYQAAKLGSEMTKRYHRARETIDSGHIHKALKILHDVDEKIPGFLDTQELIAKLSLLESKKQIDSRESAPQMTSLASNQSVAKSKTKKMTPLILEEPPQASLLVANTTLPDIPKLEAPAENQPLHLPTTAALPKKSKTSPAILSGSKPQVKMKSVLNSEPTQVKERSVKHSIPHSNLPETRRSPQHITYWLLLTTSLIAVMAMGVFLPESNRAWFLSLIGKKMKARKLYEKILTAKPDQLWLYIKLAELYDLEGRKDRQAIRVYTMVQHLNINNRAINNLRLSLSNRYLSGVQTEPVHIEIMQTFKK